MFPHPRRLSKPAVYVGDLTIELWLLFGKSPQNPNDEIEVRRNAPFFFFEQSDSNAVVTWLVYVKRGHQPVVGEDEEVGLARSPWPYQKNIVLL